MGRSQFERESYMLGILALATVAAQPLPTVFGQPLGQPLAYPECTFKVATFDHKTHLYDPDQNQPCFEQISDDPEIIFPIEQTPAIISIGAMFTKVIDGKVEEISTATVDHNYADSVIGQLTEKLGKPIFIGPEKVVLNGIALSGTLARWRGPGYTANYHSLAGDVGHGSLEVSTDRAIAAQTDRQRERAAKRIGL